MISAVHVVSSIAEEAAGTTYAIRGYCEALASLGDQVSLHCLEKVELQQNIGVYSHPQWPYLARLGISSGMHRALRAAATEAGIMHAHSLWAMPSVYPAWATRGKSCRLVASPHGTLAPAALGRSHFAKACFWPLQKEALSRAACLHATAQSEYHHIRSKSLVSPVAVIPIGVDIPQIYISPILREFRDLLYFGRVHPIKGIDLLLKVWSRVEPLRPDWRLRIVGPDNEGYLQEMKHLSKDLFIQRASFENGVYGKDKVRLFQSVDLYILPSHTENFGITVVEALANGVPSIVTKGAPWQGIVEHSCGWWVTREEKALYEALMEATSLSEEDLRSMGERGRAWMQRDFAWEQLGRKLHLTYEWLLGGGPPPDWVLLD
jgi:glycosyltransferase involved in cell wall biosynthesis